MSKTNVTENTGQHIVRYVTILAGYVTLINPFMPLKLIILQEPIIKLLDEITGSFLLSVCYFKLLIVPKNIFCLLYYKNFKVLIFIKFGLFVTFGDLNNVYANLRYNLHYLSIRYRCG